MPLPDGVRTFLVFRDLLVESALQTRELQQPRRGRGPDLVQVHRQVAAFLDDVLVAFIQSYLGVAG